MRVTIKACRMLPAIERYANTFPPPAEIAGCYYDNQTTYDYDDAQTVACWREKNGNPAIDENAAKLVIGWWPARREDIPGILSNAVSELGCPGALGCSGRPSVTGPVTIGQLFSTRSGENHFGYCPRGPCNRSAGCYRRRSAHPVRAPAERL
jgi:hypothetical protein